MSEELHVVLGQFDLEDESGEQPTRYIWAAISINGKIQKSSLAHIPVVGAYKTEATARKSAISLALFRFTQYIGTDVREVDYASPAPVDERL